MENDSLSLKVLIVDDEPMFLQAVAGLIEHMGHHVTTAVTGEEVLEIIDEVNPDVLLSDIRMPGMDGIHLLECVRKDNVDLPVILMTGYAESYSLEDAFYAGADEYITKPFKRDELQVMLQRAFWRRMATKRKMRETLQ